MPPGSIVNAVGVGVTAVMSEYSGMKVNMVPQTSEMVWMPMFATGEADLGIGTSFPMHDAYMGVNVFEDIAKQSGVKGFPVRMLFCGSWISNCMCVRGDSPIKHSKDVKGHRVMYYPEGTFGWLGWKGGLAMEGLTFDDVIKVPVSNMVEAARALMDNRLDVADIGMTAPAAVEAVAAVQMRYLPRTFTDESLARLWEVAPVFYPREVKKGQFPGVEQDMTTLAFDVYFVARTGISDEAAYELVKACWEHNDEMTASPVAKAYTTDKFVTKHMYVPYHPGAIKFYKEKGVWTAEHDALQAAVLAKEPK